MRNGTCGRKLKWTLDDYGNLIIRGTGKGIRKRSFENNLDIKCVKILNGLLTICSSAFKNCTSLSSVEIPGSVNRIGAGAFQNCTGLKSVIIHDDVKKICLGAFKDCTNLEKVKIADSVINIEAATFYNCSNLESVIIPPVVNTIGNDIFFKCTKLQKIYYKAGSDFKDKLREGNTAELISYYKLIPQGGITIKSFPSLSSGSENYYAEKVILEDSLGEVTVKISEGMIDRFIFILDRSDTLIIKDNGMLSAIVAVAAQEIATDAEIELARIVAQVQKNCCGKNVTWMFLNDTLTISGTGSMNDYSRDDKPSWYDKRESIKKIIIDNGVTRIGSTAFQYFKSLER